VGEAAPPRSLPLSAVAGGLATLGLVAVFALDLDVGGVSFLWDCPFKTMTGIPCVTCGITRVFVLLGHGEVREALALAPFPFLLVTGSVAAGAVALYARLTSGRDPDAIVFAFLRPRAGKVLTVVSVLALWGYAIARSLHTGAP